MIEQAVQYVVVAPTWVHAHASMVSFVSFAFLIYAVMNIQKRGFDSFFLPVIAGGAILWSAYPVFNSYPYAIIGWVLIAGLLSAFRWYVMVSSDRVDVMRG
jgi:hypothetical protein